MSYTYTASGRKLAEEYFSADKTISRVRQLIGSFELVNGSLDRIQIGSGYITKQGTYNIFIPDYQGNVVGVYDTSQRRLIQTTDYYPYGQPLVTSTGAEVNRHKFGGKEYSTEFGLGEADFVARRYAPLWGGFTGPDPKAIDYPQFSPWAYCAGDPVNIIDKYGEDIIFVGANNSSLTFTTNWFSYSINLSPLGLDFKGNYTLPGGECASLMLDIIGIVEPTGIVDFANAGLRGLRGDFVGAGISVAGATLPYIGDLAKVSRIQEELAEYGVNFVWQHNRAIGKAAEALVKYRLEEECLKKGTEGQFKVYSQVYA